MKKQKNSKKVVKPTTSDVERELSNLKKELTDKLSKVLGSDLDIDKIVILSTGDYHKLLNKEKREVPIDPVISDIQKLYSSLNRNLGLSIKQVSDLIENLKYLSTGVARRFIYEKFANYLYFEEDNQHAPDKVFAINSDTNFSTVFTHPSSELLKARVWVSSEENINRMRAVANRIIYGK